MSTRQDHSAEQTVFVVDDDPAHRNALRMLIHLHGLRVEPYSDGASFLAEYRSDRPGCVLLDQGMPGLTGLQVQQALNERSSRIPVIFLSGHADAAMQATAMGNGAFDCLRKPIQGDRLLDCVTRALQEDRDRRRSSG